MIVLQPLTILYYATLAIHYILHYTIPYYTILCVLMLVLYCYPTRVVFTTGCTVIMNSKLIVDMLIGTVPHIRTRVVHVYKPEKYNVALIQVGNKNTLLIYYKLKPLGEREREKSLPNR